MPGEMTINKYPISHIKVSLYIDSSCTRAILDNILPIANKMLYDIKSNERKQLILCWDQMCIEVNSTNALVGGLLNALYAAPVPLSSPRA